MGPILRFDQVPLAGIPSFSRVSCTVQFGVICKLAEGALDPTMSLIKILKSIGPKTEP